MDLPRILGRISLLASRSNPASGSSQDDSADAEAAGSPYVEMPQPMPRTPGDILAVSYLLSRCRLPDELVKEVLHHAAYDGILFCAVSREKYTARSRGSKASVRVPYVATPPLRYLVERSKSVKVDRSHEVNKDEQSSDDDDDDDEEEVERVDEYGEQGPRKLSSFSGRGRITRVSLMATGRNQGWASSPERGSFSWFELAKYKNRGRQPLNAQQFRAVKWRGTNAWAFNPVTSTPDPQRAWQTHAFDYVADKISDASETDGRSKEIASLIQMLRAGDRLCIVPMAQYPGWVCEVLAAKIEVFVEIYR